MAKTRADGSQTAWTLEAKGWVCHGVPNPGQIKYRSIARKLSHPAFSAPAGVDGKAGIVLRFTTPKNKHAVSGTFKKVFDELCPTSKWSMSPLGDETTAVGSAAVAASEAGSPSAASSAARGAKRGRMETMQPRHGGVDPAALWKRARLTSPPPSLLSGFLAGSGSVVHYPGLEASLEAPWPRAECLGQGSSVRAFTCAAKHLEECGQKSKRITAKQGPQMETVAVTSGAVFHSSGSAPMGLPR